MSRSTFTRLASVGLMMIAGASGAVAGQSASPPIAKNKLYNPGLFPTVAAPVLVATAFSFGNGNGSAIPAGTYTQVGNSKTLTCPNSGAKCQVEAISNAQITNGANVTGFAVCSMVDGLLFGGCPYINTQVPANVIITGGITDYTFGLSPGTHTLATYVYSTSAATLDFYQVTYHMYQ